MRTLLRLLHKVIQTLPDHRNSPRLARDALVLGPSAALNRDPTTTPSVNDLTQTVPQVGVPQQLPAPEPPHLVSRSGQFQEQGFSVEVAERIAAPQRSSTRTIYKSKWALFEKWCRENSVDFSTPSVKQISGLQSLTLWAQRPNILHTMQTFIGYSPVFTGIVLKVPEIYPSGTFLLSLTSSPKHHLSP